MSSSPRLGFVQCISPAGLHSMAYHEWGDPANPRVLMCVHGLTRTGRDFDTVARALSGDYRVICPDVAGRGRSEWLADPRRYIVPQYVSDMVTLIATAQRGAGGLVRHVDGRVDRHGAGEPAQVADPQAAAQ